MACEVSASVDDKQTPCKLTDHLPIEGCHTSLKQIHDTQWNEIKHARPS